MDAKQQLLSDWDNRPSAVLGDDAARRIRNEIHLLEALKKARLEKTRDGLSVKMQLEVSRDMLREILRHE
jgi:hypothetical protein